jgi:uncharacterized membrane protein YsdA (DUF1294 family)
MKIRKGSESSAAPSPPSQGPFFCRLANRFSGFPGTVWLLLGGIFFYTGHLFLTFGVTLLFSSFFSVLFYGTDKILAEEEAGRIPEANLLMWDLFWGWPGGLCARYIFRHKTRKISFRIFFCLTALANILLTYCFIRYRNELYELRNILIKTFSPN